jgi:hypothetical protein
MAVGRIRKITLCTCASRSKYDPYSGAFIAWYFGGFGLIGALIFVFFFSHRRVWDSDRQTGTGTVEI